MYYPTISQYAYSVSHPDGLFRTLGKPVCERNAYGEPIFTAGGNAAVFKIHINGKAAALKCYTRPEERCTAGICDYFGGYGCSLAGYPQFLPEEIYVYDAAGRGGWYDALICDWVEGATLDYAIRKALHYADSASLTRLARSFDRMAAELLRMPWAHGDLKPANIIVQPSGEMRPIDFDALFYPGMDGERALEKGTPQYCHPERNSYGPGKFLDDYPIALLSSTLHALAADPSLSERFGTPDIFLIAPEEAVGGTGCAYSEIRHMAAKRGDAYLHRLLSYLSSPVPHLPGLGEIMDRLSEENPLSSRATDSTVPFRENGKWGYSLNGERIIPPLFDTALDFTEGIAAVALDGCLHFVDASGTAVINCSDYERIKPFSCGLAAVRRNGLWGYIDHSGLETIAPAFRTASSFRKGSAAVTSPGGSTCFIHTDKDAPYVFG